PCSATSTPSPGSTPSSSPNPGGPSSTSSATPYPSTTSPTASSSPSATSSSEDHSTIPSSYLGMGDLVGDWRLQFVLGVFRLAGWAGLWDGVFPLRTIPSNLAFCLSRCRQGARVISVRSVGVVCCALPAA